MVLSIVLELALEIVLLRCGVNVKRWKKDGGLQLANPLRGLEAKRPKPFARGFWPDGVVDVEVGADLGSLVLNRSLSHGRLAGGRKQNAWLRNVSMKINYQCMLAYMGSRLRHAVVTASVA